MKRHQQDRGFKSKADQSKAAVNLLARAQAPELEREYIIAKYWTGNFRGRCTWISEMRTLARFAVTDPMRKSDHLFPCPFPGCILETEHAGDHRLTNDVDELRVGTEVEVDLRFAQILPAVFEQFQKRETTKHVGGESREEFERDRFGQSGGSKS